MMISWILGTESIQLFLREPRTFWRKAARFLRPMRKDYRQRLNMTLGQWLLNHQKNISHKQCYWMGVRAVKNPLDVWIYQEILHEVKPDVIIEIGSAEGGTTLYLAHLCDLLGNGNVVSIDIDRSVYKAKHDRIITITGNSASDEVVAKATELCQGKSVLVIHDGDHSKPQVLKDLSKYAPLVTPNSYFIVEDGIVDLFTPGDGLGWFEDGPLEASEQFVKENPDFVVDEKRERYFATYNPRGFLKRIQ